MATNPYVNKVIYGDQTVIDLTMDTLTASNLSAGVTGHDRSGAPIVGTANYYSPSDTAETTIDDADYFPYYDTSATAKRKSLWSNIKSVLKTYFVSLFVDEKTKAQYDALPSADKNNPDKVYYVPDYEDTSKTWVRLDDSTTANDKVWSSSKIATELGGVAEIDDTTTSATKAWSSNKIQTEINSKLAYSENDTTGTIIDDADFVPYYDYSESARQKITFANVKAKLKSYFDTLYAAISHTHTTSDITNFPTLATVATSGNYNDLSNKPTIPAAQIQSDWNQTTTTALDYIKNKPTIPAAQVNSDWDASGTVAEILNKPTLATVATTGDYDDLTDKPDVDKVYIEKIESDDNHHYLLFANSAVSSTETNYAAKSSHLSYNPYKCRLSIDDGGGRTYYLPGDLLHYLYRNVTVSAGTQINIPSSGTSGYITADSIVIPVADANSDGTPKKFKECRVYDGHVSLYLSQDVTNCNVGILIQRR